MCRELVRREWTHTARGLRDFQDCGRHRQKVAEDLAESGPDLADRRMETMENKLLGAFSSNVGEMSERMSRGLYSGEGLLGNFHVFHCRLRLPQG